MRSLHRVFLIGLFIHAVAFAGDLDCPDGLVKKTNWYKEWAIAAVVLGPLSGILAYQLTDGFRVFERKAPIHAEEASSLVAPEWIESDEEELPLPGALPLPAADGGTPTTTYGSPR